MDDFIIEENKVYNLDCLDVMQKMLLEGVKADWVITDPPYAISYASMCAKNNGTKYGKAAAAKKCYNSKDWDNEKIDKKYFDLMMQVSDNQIIFGGNYYTDILPATKSWVIWDKRCDDKMRNDFADCEMAWCSQGVARVFHYMYNGMIQDNMKNKDERFHPTQKPVAMWVKLLNYYTKENDLILDPFAGSLSLAVACHRTNRRYICCERDTEYYEKGMKWLEKEKAQMSIFDYLKNDK